MNSDGADQSFDAAVSSETRHGWRKWLIRLAVVGLVLFLVSLAVPVLICCGGVERSVDVVVIGQISNDPVESAEVRVMEGWGGYSQDTRDAVGHSEWLELLRNAGMLGNVDSKGEVRLRVRCGAGWTPTIFGGKKGNFSLNHILEVSHPDYEPVRVTLASLVGGDRFPLSKKELAVKVWLIPKTTQPAPSDHAPGKLK